MTEPRVTKIKNGWAAHGDGWAVHGTTRAEAIFLFHERKEKYREIDARTFTPEVRTGNLRNQEQPDKVA